MTTFDPMMINSDIYIDEDNHKRLLQKNKDLFCWDLSLDFANFFNLHSYIVFLTKQYCVKHHVTMAHLVWMVVYILAAIVVSGRHASTALQLKQTSATLENTQNTCQQWLHKSIHTGMKLGCTWKNAFWDIMLHVSYSAIFTWLLGITWSKCE